MPGQPAARVTAPTTCSTHGPHPIGSGSPDVFFNGLAAFHSALADRQPAGGEPIARQACEIETAEGRIVKGMTQSIATPQLCLAVVRWTVCHQGGSR